uniref:PRA1 family protein n=1 Tax=Setaria digitata TaxID=48799 RepID=A0A915Q2V0_9BILA
MASTATSPSVDDVQALLKVMKATSPLERLESEQSSTSFCTANYNPSLIAVAVFGLMNTLYIYLISLKSWPAVLSGACFYNLIPILLK